jgi:hypothetical protein
VSAEYLRDVDYLGCATASPSEPARVPVAAWLLAVAPLAAILASLLA